MILKASQRGGGMALAAHLLKAENEHVEIHEISGFVSDDLKGAMKEAQAVAKGTRCRQYLFSVSLNPPETESVSVAKFEAAIERVEKANGLDGQPRMIVFHEKEGRRHAHVVWSRIDTGTMTARPLPFFKQKLREISKGLYLEHGWQMPRGLIDSREHDPRNFTLAEWQQAKRMGRDPKQLKALMQECWASSDGRPAFEKALQARGLYLAKGDRRGHVAFTYEGEVISVARMAGVKAKDVAAKLGSPEHLPDVEDAKRRMAETVAPRLEALLRIAREARTREMQPIEQRRIDMKERHASERQALAAGQETRFEIEARKRAAKFRTGIAGLWDRFTGKHAALRKENEREAFHATRRDRAQRDDLVADQLKERRGLQREIVAVRQRYASRVSDLHRDIARLAEARERGSNLRDNITDTSIGRSKTSRSPPGRGNRLSGMSPDV